MLDPPLPPELFDHIVDLLNDQPETLKRCCLVSKSWVSRARRHIFSEITFCFDHDFARWKKAFPDPAASPACYTRSLNIHFVESLAALVHWGDGLWIRTFSNVVRLILQ